MYGFLRNAALCALLLAASVAAVCAASARHHYAIDLDVDFASGVFAGTMTATVANFTPHALSEVWFRLYANGQPIYGEARIDVRSVQVDRVPVDAPLFLDNTALLVPLPTALLPGQTTSIALSFDGRAATPDNVDRAAMGYGLLTKIDRVLTLTTFYPVIAPVLEEGWILHPVCAFGDALSADAADYDVTLCTSALVTVIPPPAASQRGADRTCGSWSATAARDIAFVLCDDGRLPLSETRDEWTATAWFEPAHGAAAPIAVDRALGSIALFARLLGPPPGQILHIVEVPLGGVAGMELAGMILVGSAYGARPRDPFFDVIVSHEVAHQWFYALVGSDSIAAPWLDEALATYLSNVFLADAVAETRAAEERRGWLASYAAAQRAHPALSPGSPLYAFPDAQTYSAFVYSGGALALHAARLDIGDAAFFGALAEYVRRTSRRFATPEDLLAVFAEAGTSALARGIGPTAERNVGP